jgi:hypothetical protein
MIITVKNEMNRISLRLPGDPKVYLTYDDAKYLADCIYDKLEKGEEVEYAE